MRKTGLTQIILLDVKFNWGLQQTQSDPFLCFFPGLIRIKLRVKLQVDTRWQPLFALDNILVPLYRIFPSHLFIRPQKGELNKKKVPLVEGKIILVKIKFLLELRISL